MSTASPVRATLDDLYQYPGKAELIGGRIRPLMATGFAPNRAAGRIYRSLDDYAEKHLRGVAVTDNMGFAVPELPSGRESFSPDAAYYFGPMPPNAMRFIQAPPTLAVEVRSEGDYIPSAEVEMAAKRGDYFLAGTLVVWDVDPINKVVMVYRADAPDSPSVYHSGNDAEAEPAVPGWRVSVDWIFG
jgi:Uma2 family endonuclease